MLPNWFSSVSHNFKYVLSSLKGKEDLVFLQIGAYTGDASLWLINNVLTNETSFLIDVDTWSGSDEGIHKTFDWYEVEQAYLDKTLKYPNIHSYKMTSDEYFESIEQYEYDFVYIDGDHTARAVEQDANNAWYYLKSGGILAFDDYLWKHESNDPQLSPKPAIDSFLEKYKDDLEVIIKNYQVWVKKK